jgi:hypothetical protein
VLVPGVGWTAPQASPAGGQIVFLVRESSGLGRIELLDTNTGGVRQLASSRSAPVFLNSGFIWYKGENLCPPADAFCSGSAPYLYQSYLTGKTYIYDLRAGIETESKIAEVYDTWPHPA